jgi:hypothetical protein
VRRPHFYRLKDRLFNAASRLIADGWTRRDPRGPGKANKLFKRWTDWRQRVHPGPLAD